MKRFFKVAIVFALFILAVPVSAITSPYHPADKPDYQISFGEFNNYLKDYPKEVETDAQKEALSNLFNGWLNNKPYYYWNSKTSAWDVTATRPEPGTSPYHPADRPDFVISFGEFNNYVEEYPKEVSSSSARAAFANLLLGGLFENKPYYYRHVTRGWQTSATRPDPIAGSAGYSVKTPVETGSIVKGTSTLPVDSPYGSIRSGNFTVYSPSGIESRVNVSYIVDITTGSNPVTLVPGIISAVNKSVPNAGTVSAPTKIYSYSFPTSADGTATLASGTTTRVEIYTYFDPNKLFSGKHSFTLDCVLAARSGSRASSCIKLSGTQTIPQTALIVGEKQAQLHSVTAPNPAPYGSEITISGANFNKGSNNVRFGYHRRQNNSTTFTPLVTKTGASSDGKQLKVTLPTSTELENREVILVQVQNPRTPQGSLFNYGWSNLRPVNLTSTPTEPESSTTTPSAPSVIKAQGVSSLVDDSYQGRNADSRYWAKNLIDGSSSTYAYTSNFRMGYVIELGGGYSVSRVKLNWGRFGGAGYVRGYSLYGRTPAGRWLVLTSRDAGTAGVGSLTDNTFKEEFLVTHIAVVSGGSLDTNGNFQQGDQQSGNWVGIYEVEIYGRPAGKGSLNSQVANVLEALRTFLLNLTQ